MFIHLLRFISPRSRFRYSSRVASSLSLDSWPIFFPCSLNFFAHFLLYIFSILLLSFLYFLLLVHPPLLFLHLCKGSISFSGDY